jgi:catechol 2,3-dioxygenase-like lactoylglutathione lyase family enzyme
VPALGLTLGLRRIILFTRSLDAMTAFYRDVLGLELLVDEKGWKEFSVRAGDAGGVRLALHAGEPAPGKTKLAFFTDEVEKARDELVKRGAKMRALKGGDGLDLCDGEDPDGNPFQLSNRR